MDMDTAETRLLKQVSRKRDALLGFVLGTSFESHRARLLEFAREGFDDPPTKLDANRRVIMLKRDAQGFERAAFVLCYDAASRLVDARLLLGGDNIGSAADAHQAAASLRDLVLEHLGAPSVYLDSIEAWAAEGAYIDNDISAYSAFWTAGSGANTRVESAQQYSETLKVAAGPVTSVNISSAQSEGQLEATVIVQVRA